MSVGKVENPPAIKVKNRVESKDLHAQAELRAREYIDSFAEALLLQSKTLAAIQEADVVLSTHVDDARDIIIKAQKRGRARELTLIFGSALLGAFIQGFPTELAAGRKVMTLVYTALGFLGMLLIFVGLRR
jgi:hypothetical protein